MAIYLVQHGLSLPKTEDPEKGLSAQGVSETEQIAEVAAAYRIAVDCILHSGKKRALQTAAIFKKVLLPPRDIRPRDGLGPLDDVSPWPRQLMDRHGLMLVGHLPFMEKLTGLMTTGSADVNPFRFQNSGIVCLDPIEGHDRWQIKWTLSPHIE